MKTIEEIYDRTVLRVNSDGNFNARNIALTAMEELLELGVDKALQVAADELDGDGCYDYGANCDIEVKRSNILSLAPQILEELKGGECES